MTWTTCLRCRLGLRTIMRILMVVFMMRVYAPGWILLPPALVIVTFRWLSSSFVSSDAKPTLPCARQRQLKREPRRKASHFE